MHINALKTTVSLLEAADSTIKVLLTIKLAFYADGAKPNNAITNNPKNKTTKDSFLVSSCF